jgi:hypothetical protein
MRGGGQARRLGQVEKISKYIAVFCKQVLSCTLANRTHKTLGVAVMTSACQCNRW